jgi:hypothetical protein
MSLADDRWTRISVHTMALEYLRAERKTHLASIPDATLDHKISDCDSFPSGENAMIATASVARLVEHREESMTERFDSYLVTTAPSLGL